MFEYLNVLRMSVESIESIERSPDSPPSKILCGTRLNMHSRFDRKISSFPHHPSKTLPSIPIPIITMADIEVFDGAVGIDLGMLDLLHFQKRTAD